MLDFYFKLWFLKGRTHSHLEVWFHTQLNTCTHLCTYELAHLHITYIHTCIHAHYIQSLLRTYTISNITLTHLLTYILIYLNIYTLTLLRTFHLHTRVHIRGVWFYTWGVMGQWVSVVTNIFFGTNTNIKYIRKLKLDRIRIWIYS